MFFEPNKTTNVKAKQPFLEMTELLGLLERYHIDLNTWGSRNSAKDVEDLLAEINDGEATLVEENGKLLRHTKVCRVLISGIADDGSQYRLVEDRQIFKSGDVRRRPTPWAVWEKIVGSADPEQSALRGIDEELSLNVPSLEHGPISLNSEAPMDYPGISTELTCYDFKLELRNPDLLAGFQESQTKKTTQFVWQPYYSEISQRGDSLLTLSLLELQKLVRECAERCHHLLVARKFSANEGIVIAESFSSGRIAEALSSFDGSSKYLRGAIYPSLATFNKQYLLDNCAFMQVTEHLANNGLSYSEKNNLPGSLIIANCAIENLPYGIELHFRVQDKKINLFLSYDKAAKYSEKEFIARSKEIAALLALECLLSQLPSELKVDHTVQSSPSANLQANQEIKRLNREAWSLIEPVLKSEGKKLIVGESFTFGKLAKLFTEEESSQTLETAYGWYDARYKIAVGVNPQRTSDELIAEPETVIQGARGLLENLAPTATIAIGTSGWANYWKPGEADYFSVACVSRVESGFSSDAVRVSVSATQAARLDFTRRELTRELGVTSALFLITEALKKSELGGHLTPLADQLRLKLEENGEVRREIALLH
jgi:nicotinamide mononucleotide (NMN) deamidase PncC